MRVEEVISNLLNWKNTLISIDKAGGEIEEEAHTNNDFAGDTVAAGIWKPVLSLDHEGRA